MFITTLILLISVHINYYGVILSIYLCVVKTPDIGSLFLTFNNFLCVLLQLLLFEGHTAD